MTFDEVMAQLEAMGTAQNRKVYARHGARGAMFGVSFANLSALQKKIKVDQRLADRLWKSGNVDAKTLACMIADPLSFDRAKVDAWIEAASHYVLVGLVSGRIASRHPSARQIAEGWIASRVDLISDGGWDVVACLALRDPSVEDAYFAAKLKTIEAGIDSAPNRTRHGMNAALIAIGGRNDALQKLAIAAAGRIGKVVVDHGETGCKTPEAIPYIRRMAERRQGRGGGAKKRGVARAIS